MRTVRPRDHHKVSHSVDILSVLCNKLHAETILTNETIGKPVTVCVELNSPVLAVYYTVYYSILLVENQ